jgi:hypothetical protein
MALLGVVSAKDLRDVSASVLFDHRIHTSFVVENQNGDAEQQNLFIDYVLNPRVANEFLTPYKEFFTTQIDDALLKTARENPAVWADWVRQHIAVRDELNPLSIPIMPAGVWKARVADAHSRDIFFIASARSMGIPARFEPVTGKVQYYTNQWIDVRFDTAEPHNTKKGCVTASYRTVKSLDNPKYYSHFTIARIRPDGQLQTLNFETEGDTDMGAGGTWAGILKNPLALDEGNYLLVSGMRMASGKALAQILSFTVEADKTESTTLVMREDDDDVQVIGNMDAEALFRTADGREETSILNTTGRGYFVVGILGANQEPTNHAMRDIAQFKNDFELWGRPMILLFGNEEGLQRFNKNEFGELPSLVTYGIDIDDNISKMIVSATKLPNTGILPVFIIADTFGRIVFVSQGYTIGLGEQMMKVIHKL